MQQRHHSGFSLVEVVVATSIFLSLVVLVSSLAVSGTDAHDLGRRIARMTEVAQEVTDDIRLQMVSSMKVFGDDAVGNASLDMIDLSDAPPPIATRRLPTIRIAGSFRTDEPGDEITGNTILFAYLAWRDRYRCASGAEYLVDVYRWVHYYMSPKNGGPSAGSKGGLELVRFVGEPLADAEAIDNIVDPVDRAEVLLHMRNGTADIDGETHAPIQVVWARSMDPTAVGAFRQIDDGDGSLSLTPITDSGRPSPWSVLSSPEGTGGLLDYRRASVASNYELVAPGISRFAVRDDARGFPHGLEVQVIGPTSARQMLLHLVLVDTTRKGAPAWSQMQTVITAHDR